MCDGVELCYKCCSSALMIKLCMLFAIITILSRTDSLPSFHYHCVADMESNFKVLKTKLSFYEL